MAPITIAQNFLCAAGFGSAGFGSAERGAVATDDSIGQPPRGIHLGGTPADLAGVGEEVREPSPSSSSQKNEGNPPYFGRPLRGGSPVFFLKFYVRSPFRHRGPSRTRQHLPAD